MTATQTPINYGADVIVLHVPARFPVELRLDDCGDYTLNVGYYGIHESNPAGWSVETGFGPLGRDMAYWAQVRDHVTQIDAWLVEHRPTAYIRLSVRFVGDRVVIDDYDHDRPLFEFEAGATT